MIGKQYVLMGKAVRNSESPKILKKKVKVGGKKLGMVG